MILVLFTAVRLPYLDAESRCLNISISFLLSCFSGLSKFMLMARLENLPYLLS
jgi:hypothetical protein